MVIITFWMASEAPMMTLEFFGARLIYYINQTYVPSFTGVLHSMCKFFIEPPLDTQRTERQGERGI